MQNRTVLPEFIGIITPFRFEIQALAENVGKDGKANPNTMSNKRSSILGIIEDWVNNDYIEYKKEGDNKDSPNILKINFGEFRKYVMEAFNDVREAKQKNQTQTLITVVTTL
jgi:hypothetical protein